nr:hypothetical protein [Tanacetum cinerariifolium]
MPPRMGTQSAGRPAGESLGGGTGVWVGNQENVGNQNGNVVNENVQENVRNVLVNGNQVGYSYKEFLACNPKEYDRNGGVVVLTRWIEKMESVHDMSGCSIDQKVKYAAGSFVGKALTWMIERYVYGLAPHIREMVAATKPQTIQKGVQISGAMTDEAIRNGSIKKIKKRGNLGEPSKDKSGRDDNKRTRTGNVFSTTMNPVGRENTCTWPKCTTCNSYHAPRGPCHTCFNCNRPRHLEKDYRDGPRNVNPVNARNPPIRACHECGSTNHVRNQENQARGGAFMFGAEEARQDLNIVTGMFTLMIILPLPYLKDKLCKAPVLALPDGPEDFVVYCDASEIGLGCVLMQRGKANVVADALSRKARVKPNRVRAMNMTLQLNIKDRILSAQKEVLDESSMQEVLGTRLDMSTAYHPQTDCQSERTIQTLEDMLRVCVLDFGGSWDVHLPLAEVVEGQLIGPKLVQETTEKIS